MNKRIIHTVFDQQAARWPQSIAITEGAQAHTYGELKATSDLLAQHILVHSQVLQTPVAVLLPAGFQLVSSMIAVFRSGHIYVPLDAAFNEKRMLAVFGQTEPAVCITSQALYPVVEKIRGLLGLRCEIVIVDALPALPANVPAWPDVQPQDANYIFYTSGSTGEAKAILGCHDSLSHFIHWESKEFNLDSSCKVSQLSQFTFDASLRDVWVPLINGGTLCIPPPDNRSNMPALLAWLEQQEVTLVHCVPSVFRLLTRELVMQQKDGEGKRLPRLQRVIMAGEQLYAKDIQQWRSTGAGHAELVNFYGASETTMCKTFHRIGDAPADPAQPIHVGKPISNTLIAIINNGALCRAGEIGEVYIITPFMTKGYYRNKELTDKVFVQNPLVKDRAELVYRTGDYGTYLPDGSIEIFGRKDDQVKVNGIRVELGEVKQAVLRMPGIENAEVIALKNANEENELVCYYITADVNEDGLRQFLKEELSASVIPSGFVRMEEFPLTINGKVDKKALPKPGKVVVSEADYVQAVSPTELKLEVLWQELLGMDRIGTGINFFRLGGSSLKLMKMVSRIFYTFNVSLTYADVFANNTIRELAARIDTSIREGVMNVNPIAAKAYYEVTYAQRRLWIYDSMNTQKHLYNMVQAVSLNGAIEPALLKDALTALVTRHEILRTTFINVGGEPKQRVADVAHAAIPFTYYDEAQTLQIYGGIYTIIHGEQHRAFNLEKGPLFIATLAQTAPGHFYLIFNWHHIISDGWSQDVLLNDLLVIYNALAAKKSAGLQPLRFQFRDYADWSNKQLEGKRLEELKQYWNQRLALPFTPVMFPPTIENNDLLQGRGVSTDFKIDTALTASLRAVAQQAGVTNFIALQGIVNVLLYRYTGNADVITGSPFSGRGRLQVEDQAGLYVNLLPLRVQITASDNYFTLLGKCLECLTGAQQHQDYPIDMLIEDLELPVQAGRMPMFEVLVQSQTNLEFGITAPEGIRVEQLQLVAQTSKASLTFNFQQQGSEILCSIEYDSNLYDAATIAVIIENFIAVTTLLSTAPGTMLKDVSILKPAQEADEEQRFINALQQL